MKSLAKIFGIAKSKPGVAAGTIKDAKGDDDADNAENSSLKDSGAHDYLAGDDFIAKIISQRKNQTDDHHSEDNIKKVEEFTGSFDEFKLMEEEEGISRKIASSAIVPNPFQPRKTFNEEALEELAASIREHGIIQPLIVRPHGTTYQIVAGERRLRASKMIGLSEVPVIVRRLTDREMAELAIIENLQREDLHFLEEAEGFSNLIANFDLTQEALAKRMGKSQSAVANKLRLLKLSGKVCAEIFNQKLTERHARALLRLDDEAEQFEILEMINQKKLNVRQTEEVIEKYLETISREKLLAENPRQKITKIVKDVRIFINTIGSVMDQMKKNGMDIDYKEDFDGEYVTITMQIKNSKKI